MRRRCAHRLHCARPSAHIRRWRALAAPQRKRPCDRRQRVPIAAPDPARQHHQDRRARSATVPSRRDLRQRRHGARIERALQRPRAKPVTHDHQRAAGLTARCQARRAARRPSRRARRRTFCPRLDVDLAIYDPSLASRLFSQGDPRSTAGRGARHTAPPTLCPALRRCPVSRRPSTTPNQSSRETDLRDGLHHRHGPKTITQRAPKPRRAPQPPRSLTTIADAVLDRLVHNAHKIKMKAPSRRKENAQTAA